ncbi:outer membrane protein [Hyphococcus sp.]|uniref:outer membrane protein n=1 Tax=Hyphococcus sp. TaxID=2038636 RepID=UPI0020839D07|nr:MAG: P44/Msp2 family outer membrane protein [Marinicaulis sp.]
MLKVASIVIVFGGLAAGQAAAEDKGSWYASGQFGVRAVEQEEFSAPGLAAEFELHNGIYASGAIGRSFNAGGINLRLEGETAWRGGGDVRNYTVNGGGVPVAGNGISALSFMANGFVDFENASRFTPYIGAGVGVAKLSSDISDGANSLNDSATSFAAQGVVGIDVAVSERVSVFTDLRYFKASGTTMTLQGSAGSGDVNVDYDAYTVGLGLKLNF